MRAFGIDPGIGRTGWGVIEKKGASYTVTNFGLIETAKTLPMHTRLQMLYNDLTGLLEKYNPDCVAVEDLFFNTNAKTALIVGQARGVVLLACANYGLLPSVYTPLQVKIAITGYGRAEKNQVGI